MTAKEQNKELLRAGAYLLPDAPIDKDVHVDNIDVRIYTHPALGDRTVAKLTPNNLALGEDNAMSFFGFGEPEVTGGVAKRARQALGFPEWVLVHDAKNAAKALEISKKLKKAARRAKSKPGHAKDDFDAMGDELSKKLPHFLPSYYEEVARAFLEANNTNYAASSFGKAREAEKVYALEVDEERRREAFLEFALAGALTNKVMTEYAGDLSSRHGAEKAYEYFFDLAVRRTLGGTPPHAQMVTQLRKLAKAAGNKPMDEDLRFLGEVWDSPSVNKAPKKYWDTYKKAYIKMCEDRPEVRGRLINTFPSPSGKAEGFKASWLEFLDGAGALESVLAEEADSIPEQARVDENAATWFGKMLQHRMDGGYYWRQSTLPDVMFNLLRRMAPRLKKDGEALQFDRRDGWYSWVDIDLLDLSLELGIETRPLEDYSSFDLDKWSQPPEESEERPRDLVFVGKDERFEQPLDNAVGNVFGNATFQKAAHGVEGLEVARRKWLERRANEFGDGAMPSLFSRIDVLNRNTSAGTFSEFPDVYETLNNADPIPSIARTLNTGIIDEFAWPIYEEVLAELAGDKDENVNMGGVFPYLILYNERKCVVINHTERVLEHDFQLPQNQYPRHIRYAQGQVVIQFYDQNWNRVAYWSGNPKEHFECDGYPSGASIAVELEDGSISEGNRALVAGDETPNLYGQVMVSDGETFWRAEGWYQDRKLVEYDPKTGQAGRTSMPKFYEDWAETDKKIQIDSGALYPLPKGLKSSPLGSKDGLYGWRVRTDSEGNNWEYERIDGTKPTGSFRGALAAFPNTKEERSVSSGSVYSADGSLQSDSGYSVNSLNNLGLQWWHYFQPRDAAGSKLLREMDEDTVRALITPAILERLNLYIASFDDGSTYLANLLQTCGDQLTTRADKATNKVLKPALESYVAWLNGGDRPDTIDGEALIDGVLANALAGTNDSFRKAVKSVLVLAAQNVVAFGQMMKENHPDKAGAFAGVGGLADGDLAQAINGITGGYYYRYGSDDVEVAPQMSIVSTYLKTGEVSGQLHTLKSNFYQFIGRPEILAFYAVAPGVDKNVRESLQSFLSLWKETGMNELAGKTRMIQGVGDKAVFGEADGWLRTEDGHDSRYWGIKTSGWNELYFDIIEYNENAKFKLPPEGFTLNSEWVTPTGAWGSDEQIDAFLAAVNESDGVVPVDKDAIQHVADKTGLTYAQAGLLWSGMPNVSAWETNFLPKELREELGLKVKEADAARSLFRNLNAEQKYQIFSNIVPEDPSKIFNPMGDGPEDPDSWANRLATAWNNAMGSRVSLPEDLMLEIEKEVEVGGEILRTILTSIVAPSDDIAFMRDVDHTVQASEDGDSLDVIGKARGVAEGEYQGGIDLDQLRSAAKVMTYLMDVPAGDPMRANARNLYELALERLGNEELLFYLEYEYHDPEKQRDFLDSIGEIKQIGKLEYADTGFLVAVPTRWSVNSYFRPAKRLAGESHPYYERKAKETGGYYNKVPFFERFISDGFKAIIDRLGDTPLDEGQYETNPLHSAPDVVKAIGAKYDVNEDAAALYAQTLALHHPTTKMVREWNGWTAGRYKKAAELLTERELVVEAKRSRAGRKHFLPGGWEALKKPNLPIETWKLAMYEANEHGGAPLGLILPLKPYHQLFEEAWSRIEGGDLPKF